MSVRFALGEAAIELPDPVHGQPALLQRRQALGRTAGGAVYVYDKGLTQRGVVLRFAALSDGQRAAMEDFFDTVCQGARNPFTYTDEHGNAVVARFLDSSLAFFRVSHDVWSLALRLELSSSGG
jgi:hypothetical protein